MSTCGRCGAVFGCAMADPDAAEPCWCTRMPPLPASAYRLSDGGGASAAAGCFCPDCLRALLVSSRAEPQKDA